VQTGDRGRPERAARIRRRDRHGRGLRGVLAPPDVPLHRTRAERFDDLVLQAVTRLEPRWEAHLAGVEFAVEEIPPPGGPIPGPVPLARLEPGSDRLLTEGMGWAPDWPAGHAEPPGPAAPDEAGWTAMPGQASGSGPGGPGPGGPGPGGPRPGEAGPGGAGDPGAGPGGAGDPGAGPGESGPGGRAHSASGTSAGLADGSAPRPPRIVVYRRPLMARADSEDDLGELVFEVIVEEFARLLGVDPTDIDPGYPEDD
jgi:predicted Zn-dependent protease with MMP-like domain